MLLRVLNLEPKILKNSNRVHGQKLNIKIHPWKKNIRFTIETRDLREREVRSREPSRERSRGNPEPLLLKKSGKGDIIFENKREHRERAGTAIVSRRSLIKTL